MWEAVTSRLRSRRKSRRILTEKLAGEAAYGEETGSNPQKGPADVSLEGVGSSRHPGHPLLKFINFCVGQQRSVLDFGCFVG